MILTDSSTYNTFLILSYPEVSPLHEGCPATQPVHIFCIHRFPKLYFFAMYFLPSV